MFRIDYHRKIISQYIRANEQDLRLVRNEYCEFLSSYSGIFFIGLLSLCPHDHKKDQYPHEII